MKKSSSLKTKNTVGIALIYVILLGVFNLLAFTVFKERSDVFWLSYSFITVAFVVQIVSMLLAFKTADIETSFLGVPLASFSVFYLCAEIVIGFIFMIFQQANFTLALVIQLILLAAFLVIAIVSLLSRDTLLEINEGIKENVLELKLVLTDVEMLRDSCGDPELKEKLRKLAQTIQYSDPMTHDAVSEIEQRIKSKVFELRAYVENGMTDDASQACRDIEMLCIERNKKLKLVK